MSDAVVWLAWQRHFGYIRMGYESRVSERLIEYIKEVEAFRDKAYPDAGYGWAIPTIGYGRTEGAYRGETTTREAEDRWLRMKADYLSISVQEIVTLRPLTQGIHDALVSFAYNTGLGSVASKKGLKGSTLLRKLNDGDLEGASAEFPRWNQSNGRVFSKLVERRAHERGWFDELS